MRNLNTQVDQQNPFAVTGSMSSGAAAFAEDAERLGFIRRTYAHLTGAILALIALETVLFTVVPANTMNAMVGRMMSGYGWLIVLAAFMGVSWMARMWANSGQSRGIQYLGLGLYVVAQAVILLPMLYICVYILNDAQIPIIAAGITGMCFIGLTAFVFVTRVDLEGWGKFLAIAGIVALCAIVASIFTG
ncbi:MAG: Bax inhibitor-1 family protein, partial [Pirellulales bacterium]|nr:Bax inhibitor-1 family protein [Pirellulales bacterium]